MEDWDAGRCVFSLQSMKATGHLTEKEIAANSGRLKLRAKGCGGEEATSDLGKLMTSCSLRYPQRKPLVLKHINVTGGEETGREEESDIPAAAV